ncbi:MAG: hypothetical protein KAI29_30160, partial [Cyclobacteriaceae bacterium]|nr:hypothetical protein [Cyclobacteriaceae bacterium]
TACRPADIEQLSNQKASPSSISPLLESKTSLANRKSLFLGYPLNMNTPPEKFFTWRNQLRKVGIGDFAFNNVGNPYTHSSIPYNTHDFEKELIVNFGKIYGFSPSDTWGFLTHSGTDSNMHGMYMGRTILKKLTGEVPKCYFTREAHYSIQILGDLLGLETVFVNTLPDASMDIEDLSLKLSEHPNHPALVVATIGTTFKGAIDHVDQIQNVLKGHESYLHLDAALFGGYLPHTSGASEVLHKLENNPSEVRYDSIAISCHKFFGFPSPAGLFITTQSNFDKFNVPYSRIHNPEYIGHVPGTITCSRDAVKPAEFYFFSTPAAIARQAKDAQAVLHNTEYLMDQMKTHFAHLLPTRSSKLSNTIYFKNPGKQIVEKYSLATMHMEANGEKQDFAHVVVMPHVTQNVLSEFLTDLEENNTITIG